MANDEHTSSEDERRVVSFRRGPAGTRPTVPGLTPVEDLAKYQDRESEDDYRNRMIVNIAGFLFVAALIGAGIWLADTMARMRKDQDCVLSGRRNCAPVEVTKERW
jgi:hypothetical protein